MLPLTATAPTLADLPAVARQVRAAIKESSCRVVAFEGEMGAGKTTLIRALAKALDVPDDVSSPTFALVNEYRTALGEPVYHFDFYRVESIDEAARMGAIEYFDSGYLCLVEWPARVAALLPTPRLEVRLAVEPNETRVVKLKIVN